MKNFIADNSINADIKKLLNVAIHNWYIFVLSILLFSLGAFVYLRYKLPIYNINSTILIDTDQSGGVANLLENLNLSEGQSNLANEIGVIKSYSTIYKTLSNLDFNVSYFVNGTIRNVEVYHQIPYEVILDSASNQISGTPIYIKILTDSTFKLHLNGENFNVFKLEGGQSNRIRKEFALEGVYKFNQPIVAEYLNIIVKKNPENNKGKDINQFYFVLNDISKVTENYVNKLEIETINKTSSIIRLSVSGPIIEKEANFLNKLSEIYIQKGLDAKIAAANNTLTFINDQLAEITDSLNHAENQLENFRTSQRIMDLSMAAQTAFSQLEKLEAERAALIVKDKYYKYILDYVSNNYEIDKLVAPSSIGIEDPLLNSLILELNHLTSEKTALTFSAKEKNPSFSLFQLKIENAKKTLLENIKNIIRSSAIALNENSARIEKAQGAINKLPKTERDLVKIQRKFNLSDHIYNYLLEKRAEVGISKAGINADNSILDTARLDNKSPGSPNEILVYLLSLFIGIVVSAAFIYIKIFFDDTINGKEQIVQYTDIPFLGAVGHNNKSHSIMPLIDAPKSFAAESLRSIRVNLQYIASDNKHKIIGVTSSISGEGKTFFTTNLAASLAISGAKVVIIGADLRKPKIGKVLNLNDSKGLSTYLSNQSKAEEIIQKTTVANLDVIVSGPVPPNPTELLGNEKKCIELIEFLKKEYEYLIIDTPPIGLVADYYLLSKFVDANIFILRQGYSKTIFLNDLNSNYAKKIKNLFVVLNDVQYTYNGYGHGYGYGYSYGYGEDANGYYETDRSAIKKIWMKLQSIITNKSSLKG